MSQQQLDGLTAQTSPGISGFVLLYINFFVVLFLFCKETLIYMKNNSNFKDENSSIMQCFVMLVVFVGQYVIYDSVCFLNENCS